MPRLSPLPSTPLTSAHRGFVYAIHRIPDDAESGTFAFSISHRGLRLHTSDPQFQTPSGADRAARQFVDDALGAYTYAAQRIAA